VSESVSRPAEVLDNLTTAVALLTGDARLLSLNAAAESLLGMSSKYAVGRLLGQIHPDFQPLAALVSRAATERQSFGQELAVRPAYQQEPTVTLSCRATPGTISGTENVILELIDATHWRQIDREQGLLSRQDASRRVMYQLAHEIRNPLGGLRGAAQLLERQLPGDEYREYTRIIIAEADRLAALTDTLLGPVRAPRAEPANIHEIIDRVAALLRVEGGQTLSLVRDYDPSLPPVVVDRDQLMQALLNIARNAMQAIDGDGRVIFRTRAQSHCLIGGVRHRLVANVEIEDDGPGIPTELGDSIFLPLVSGRSGGTGLGLPLAQEVVSRHGGLIEYRSRPGQTIFSVRLPLDRQLADLPAEVKR
jgi:two-component system, NtrC family, nitrogen regulation sensor histidine kinase GlnL